MLIVEAVRPFEARVEVGVDEYLPLVATTAPEPLPMSYYTVGNGTSALAEIKIETVSRLVREVLLVAFEGIAGPVEPADVPVVAGLPVIAAESVPEFRVHSTLDFRVTLSAASLGVDWCNGKRVDQVIRHEALSFLVGKHELLGFLVRDLSTREVDLLRAHGRRSRERSGSR